MKDNKKPMDSREKANGFDTVVAFCRKNMRYISAGILFLLLVLLLVKVNGDQDHTKQENNSQEVISVTSTQEETQSDGYEVNAYPEVNELIKSYYQACAKGDIKAVKACATPISDTEKSYLEVCSKYVEEYKNIICYTKQGLEGQEAYITSVYYEMKLKGVKTMAPGLDFFYVEKNDDGTWIINNVCSQYNLQNKEYEMDADMEELLAEFEQDEDVVALRKDVQEKYNEALESDKDLNKMITKTLQSALADWANEVLAEKDKTDNEEEQEKQEEQEKKEEQKKQEEEQKKKEEQKKQEEEQKKKEEQKKQEEEQKKKEEQKKQEEEQKKENTKSETLYATSKVNVRKKPDQNSDKIAEIETGTKVKCIGTTDDGWSKVEYEGQEAYIKSEFLSKDKPAEQPTATVLEAGKDIRLTQSIVIRDGMGEDKAKLGTAFSGEHVTVIMSYEEGWTKVSWNGKEGYARTDVIQ